MCPPCTLPVPVVGKANFDKQDDNEIKCRVNPRVQSMYAQMTIGYPKGLNKIPPFYVIRD